MYRSELWVNDTDGNNMSVTCMVWPTIIDWSGHFRSGQPDQDISDPGQYHDQGHFSDQDSQITGQPGQDISDQDSQIRTARSGHFRSGQPDQWHFRSRTSRIMEYFRSLGQPDQDSQIVDYVQTPRTVQIRTARWTDICTWSGQPDLWSCDLCCQV